VDVSAKGSGFLDDAAGPLARRLILLEDDLDSEAGADVLSARSVHGTHFIDVPLPSLFSETAFG